VAGNQRSSEQTTIGGHKQPAFLNKTDPTATAQNDLQTFGRNFKTPEADTSPACDAGPRSPTTAP